LTKAGSLLRASRLPVLFAFTYLPASLPLMKFAALVSAFLLPFVSLAYDPSPLHADDGRDLSFLLKRHGGPSPILRRAVKGNWHIVPHTLQIEEVTIRRALNGLVERQQFLESGYVPCPSGTQCCPPASVCGPALCCPAGNLACTGNCKDHFRFLVSSPFSSAHTLVVLRLSRFPRRLLPDRWLLPRWSGKRVDSTNDLANFSFSVPQVCFTGTNGRIGCCPRGQTCTTVSGEWA